MVPKFPTLAVTGGSGWGKTTLLGTILEAFGFWVTNPTTLTGTTAHAVHSYAGSTNAIPMWFDEYRPGARPEAKLALDQVIRDAWDGSATIKGGLSENRMHIKKLPARAPIAVTGEDTFSETAHAERMVMVPMPSKGRDEVALGRVVSLSHEGFGNAYLSWLLYLIRLGELPAPPAIPDRQRQARAVAEWGYSLLRQFSEEVCGCDLPPFDESVVKAAHLATADRPPILEAIAEAAGHVDRNNVPIVWNMGPDLAVKPGALCSWTKRERDIPMPGGSRAVAAWLVQAYDAVERKHPEYHRYLLVPGLGHLVARGEAA